jgi:hypothetical protein
MVTPQQEKGFRLLEKLIRTKYPWIIKLHVEDPERYIYQMTINFDINLRRLVDQYDLHDSLKKRFNNDQSSLDHFINYSCWGYLYSIVIGSVINDDVDDPDKRGGYFGNNINQEIERYSTLIYSKLPPDMVVNIFNGDIGMVEEKAPHLYSSMMDSGDRSYLREVKTLSLGCYKVIPESALGLLGGV